MALIGICGKIGSGKDLTGKVIQYLISKDVAEKGYLSKLDIVASDVKSLDKFINVSGWEIKKFADKLKEIVCILIGCKREQLEDGEFKEKELGKEWGYWTGVNLPADKFYDRDFVSEYTGPCNTKEEVEQLLRIQLVSNPNYTVERHTHTPRTLLQLLGTDCGRKILHPNIWVNALMTNYGIKDLEYFKAYPDNYNLPNWIITDVRFPNEVKAIKDRGGIVIRKLGKDSSTGTHESETALDNTKVDYEIPYCEDTETLIKIVREILIKEKIL